MHARVLDRCGATRDNWRFDSDLSRCPPFLVLVENDAGVMMDEQVERAV